ncbi:MAG: S8 family serine peptidase [Flavobacteriales bacterium]|nr:S8 family serine peptidase [Flavobacteriales bacterium]MCB9166891.1 S8 family serine peptidase [Flavobacteriales bacterium]
MKPFLIPAVLAFALIGPASLPAQSTPGPEYVPGNIIVMLTPGHVADEIVRDLRTLDGKPTELRIDRELSAPMRAWLLHFEAPGIPQAVMLREVHRHPAVMLAQNDHVIKERSVPNDPQYGSQWQHQNIDSEAAWDITTGGLTATGDTIVVCIVENADLPHPDLVANAWHNWNEIANNGVDDDGNGFVDDVDGWNAQGNNDNAYGGPHGTSVAGMIGAVGDNNLGVAGANWHVKMMPVTYASTQESAVIAAYTYPLVMRRKYNMTNGAEGAFVVATNASWGIDGGQPSDSPLWCAMYDTLGTAGILNCGATANNNVNVDIVGDLPTACSSDFMISVTATNSSDNRTFSAYGATTIDVGAPGENIFTTNIGGGYGSTSGTSFASPLTAGVIGLLYSAPCSSLMSLVHSDPEAGALFVRQALFDGVEQVGNLPGTIVTGGRVNMYNSLMEILNNCGACPGATSLSAVNGGLGSTTLSWNSSSGGPFNIEYHVVGDPSWTTLNGIVNTSFVATGLMDCTEYEFHVEVDCDTTTSGFGQSFTWTTDGCCTAPEGVVVTVDGNTSATVSWSPVLVAQGYELQVAEAGSGNWTSMPGLTTTSLQLVGLMACTAYDVQVRTDCGGTPTDWSTTMTFQTTGCGACQDETYCASVADDASEEWIAGVSLGSINHVSNSDDGYADNTGPGTDLTIGQSYTITLTPGYAGFPFTEYFTVWIDLDQNGTFGTSELLYTSPGTTNAVNGNITIPTGSTPGTTRLRVIMEYDQAAVSGCEDAYDYGETEDFCVTLIDPNVGIGESGAANDLAVFPDPADRDVFFNIRGVNGAVRIEIMDPNGRVVVGRSTTNGRATVTTAWLANGMYYYRVSTADHELGRGKLMVSHYQ